MLLWLLWLLQLLSHVVDVVAVLSCLWCWMMLRVVALCSHLPSLPRCPVIPCQPLATLAEGGHSDGSLSALRVEHSEVLDTDTPPTHAGVLWGDDADGGDDMNMVEGKGAWMEAWCPRLSH